MFLQSSKKLVPSSKKLNFNNDKVKKQEKLETSVYSIKNQTMPQYMFARENKDTQLPIQRYIKVDGYTLSAPAEEGEGNGRRCLMVKDGEPASLYINTIAADVDLTNNLKKLGIESKENMVNCAGEAFKKYGQGKIPQIYHRPVTRQTETIPFRERSFLQMLTSLCSPAPTREIERYGNPELNSEGQLTRSAENKQKAEERLRIQYNMLENVISIAKWYLSKLEPEDLDIPEGEFRQNKAQLDVLLNQYQVNENGLSLVMMGKDTFRSIRLVDEIINGGLENLQTGSEGNRLKEDKKTALRIAIEDLEYRFEQIKSEQAVSDLEPYMPTGCDISADERYRLLSFNENGGDSVAATFENKDAFPNLISWAWHYATEIKQRLTKDSLFIEDAVGKSLKDSEMMNAHWSAHIYGTDEAVSGELGLTLLNGRNAEHLAEKNVQSQCRFNQMSENFRRFCLRNVDRSKTWKLNYKIRNQVTGTLEVTLKNDLIMYKFRPQSGKDFTAAMQHFLLATADSVVEDFVITTIIGKMDTEKNQLYKNISTRIGYFVPGTRTGDNRFLIEEANIENN